MGGEVANLYVHFPFCRRKCTYCALYSRAGSSATERADYVRRLVAEIASPAFPAGPFRTVYFGGGTPALCDLAPIFDALAPRRTAATEFTVELHPLDVSDALLATLAAGGVNRLSMGVQSLDDNVLAAMGRGYTAAEAARAFARVRAVFPNAGIDLIVGYPGDDRAVENLAQLADWGLAHGSVYSLQNERGLANVPDDDTVLDQIRAASDALASLGLCRYEISNYALPGRECRHNLAVWRGEDYYGLGRGACGRLGLVRTPSGETLSPERDLKERTLFRLRTTDGLDATRFPEWEPILAQHVAEGLLKQIAPHVFRLTGRGTEVCDTILADLV